MPTPMSSSPPGGPDQAAQRPKGAGVKEKQEIELWKCTCVCCPRKPYCKCCPCCCGPTSCCFPADNTRLFKIGMMAAAAVLVAIPCIVFTDLFQLLFFGRFLSTVQKEHGGLNQIHEDMSASQRGMIYRNLEDAQLNSRIKWPFKAKLMHIVTNDTPPVHYYAHFLFESSFVFQTGPTVNYVELATPPVKNELSGSRWLVDAYSSQFRKNELTVWYCTAAVVSLFTVAAFVCVLLSLFASPLRKWN